MKKISFTHTCSGISDFSLSIYIYTNAYLDTKVSETPQSNLPDQRVNILLFRFTWVKLPIYPPISRSEMVITALHHIQLYMLSSFLCCHLELSCCTGQSYIYYLFIYLFIYLPISSCCASDCILLLLLLCF